MSKYMILGSQGLYNYELINSKEFSWKQLVFQFRNFQQKPTQSQPFIAGVTQINFPVAFDEPPAITINTTGLTISVTQNYVKITSPSYQIVPNDMTVTGVIKLEGF